MAKFTTEQAADVAAIQQVINEWGDELDQNDGLKMVAADVLTQDCRYFVGGEWREGLAAAAQFYAERKVRLDAADGAPVMRHIMSNTRVKFTAADQADVAFLLLFFARVGKPPFDTCDPAAVAEVQMLCRREADGHWRIAMFNSGQTFIRKG
jgi:ketosteroid isomerase-like protein